MTLFPIWYNYGIRKLKCIRKLKLFRTSLGKSTLVYSVLNLHPASEVPNLTQIITAKSAKNKIEFVKRKCNSRIDYEILIIKMYYRIGDL